MASLDFSNFPHEPSALSESEKGVCYAREILCHRLFLGSYDERRYVNEVNDYRDVVKIISAERELISSLNKARYRLIQYCGPKWIGITGPYNINNLESHCLWVNLKSIPFGVYWFQIKDVKYENNEIVLKLKCVSEGCIETLEENLRKLKKNTITKKENESANEQDREYSFDFDPAECAADILKNLRNVYQRIAYSITWNHVFMFFKFILAMMIILISELATCTKYFGVYSVKILEQFIILCEILSHVLIHIIECVVRLIEVFMFFMVAMYNRRTQNTYNQFPCPPRKFPYLPIENNVK